MSVIRQVDELEQLINECDGKMYVVNSRNFMMNRMNEDVMRV